MDDDFSPVHKWLNKNIIALVLIYWHLDEKGNSKGTPFVTAVSGFAMSFGESWFMVTAGHVLEDLDELIDQKYVKVVDSFIVDSLGSQAKHTDHIPYTYEKEKRGYHYADGLDFGLIALGLHERQLLEANGIVPVAIENWISIDLDRCTGFMLLGIPASLVGLEKNGQMTGINIGTALYTVKRLTEPPPGADQTIFERFMGDLGKEHSPLKGTSGGPILGFFRDNDDNLCYWVVALQSKCIKNRYIFGCPLKLFGGILLDELRQIVERMNAQNGDP